MPLTDRARGCLLGVGVGDALFGPIEFMTPEQIVAEHGGALREMVGGGWLALRPGQGTDDTEMTVCLAESLAVCGRYDAADALRRYQNWYTGGPTDVGGTVAGVLKLTCDDVPAADAARQVHVRQSGESAGNGTIMRCAPLAVALRDQPEALAAAARADAALTHHDPVTGEAGAAFCALLADRLHGHSTPAASDDPRVAAALAAEPDDADRRAGRAPGFVLTALAVACAGERIAAYHHAHGLPATDAFERALVWAGNRGGDTDTIAAVTGALLGARFGASAIPARWADNLEHRDRLLELADQLTGR